MFRGAVAEFLENNRRTLINYMRAYGSGRRTLTASAESAMNHVINGRIFKRHQTHWSTKGAHCLRQTRAELLVGRLEKHFRARFPHFRSPELGSA
jgi:hypothetical protein